MIVASSPTATEAGPSAVTESAAGGAGTSAGCCDCGWATESPSPETIAATAMPTAEASRIRTAMMASGERAPRGASSMPGGAGGSGLDTTTSGSDVCTSTWSRVSMASPSRRQRRA